jgi:hypothetical protein
VRKYGIGVMDDLIEFWRFDSINQRIMKITFSFLILIVFCLSANGQSVGINTNTPKSELSVIGISRAAFSDAEKNYIEMGHGGNNAFINAVGLGNIDFRHMDQNIMTLGSNLRVGIGTNSPDTDLSVIGKVRGAFQNSEIEYTEIFHGGDNGYINTSGDGNLDFRHDNNTKMSLSDQGHLSLNGELRPQGNSGQAGDLLMLNGNGTMSWTSPCNYSNFIDFHANGNNIQQWNVPAGVTEIIVEVWGAGGGGAAGGGGGSGAYIKAKIVVDPGDLIEVLVGLGGAGVSNGNNNNAQNGGNTQVVISNTALSDVAALGGGGATTTQPGSGNVINLNGSTQYIYRFGRFGYGNITIPIYSGTSKTIYGNGGTAFGTRDLGGRGETLISQGVNNINYPGSDGLMPGGGGGGGSQYGNDGGDGYVVIYW